MSSHVALYFVASPLQYLAARRVSQCFERGARQVLIWYQPGVGRIVRTSDWDAAAYMPWPRKAPLPGPFGRLRRLRANIRDISALVGYCDSLHIHSAVFDTEAINYFLRALPPACGARTMRARILPDGIISIRRYCLPPYKRAAQWVLGLRRLAAPELRYWRFTGDRTGSDAPFCDRIYVLSGLPNEYPAGKVCVLPPLVQALREHGRNGVRRALVIGQPLVGARLMNAVDRDAVSDEIYSWLRQHGFLYVHYKRHPKDPNYELRTDTYLTLDTDEPIECHMSRQLYDAVVGVRSSALLMARQIYPHRVPVIAFGLDRIRFTSESERESMLAVFDAVGIRLMSRPGLPR